MLSSEKWHPPIVAGILESLDESFNQGYYADKVIERKFKHNRRWGSRDRRMVAEAVYDIVRWWRLLREKAGLSWPAPTNIQTNIPKEEFEQVFSVWLDYRGRMDELGNEVSIRAIHQSIPDWMDQMAASELGDQWPKILPELNRPAPMFLRVNSLKCTKDELMRALLEEGIEVEEVPLVRSALRLKIRKNVFKTEAFKAGLFEVQDLGSQTIAPMLKPQAGERIVDACAGAGGKTLHLSALTENKGQLIALDIHEWKLKELKKRARRGGIHNVETRVIDSTKVIKRLGRQADALLLDVPCTGLGVLRRNPDSKWKLKQEEVDRLRQLQAEILRDYSKMVRVGGRMVYSTCSVLPSENQQQVKAFMDNEPSCWELEEERQLWPEAAGGDGFYMARLRRLE